MESSKLINQLKEEIDKLKLKNRDANNKIADLQKRNDVLNNQLMQLLKQTHK